MKIPVRISPFFFLTAGLIGFLNSGTLLGTLFWIAIIFFSILFHEYGHALTSLMFGQRPRIEIIAFGGLTYPEGKKLSLWKEFLVVFAGPFFGFMLFVFASLCLMLPITNPYALYFLKTIRFVNLFWTIVNLLPVLPLDGGQLVRIILEAIFGVKAWRYAHIVSIVIAASLSVLSFLVGAFIIGAIFFLFAFQSFDALKQSRNMSEEDQNSSNREELVGIQRLLMQNRLEEAKLQLEDLRQKTSRGILHSLATEYLAKIAFEQGDSKGCYELLKDVYPSISDEAKYLLHISAFEAQDFDLVIELSPNCFRSMQSVDVAVRAAAASAAKKDAHIAVEWLNTAKAYGMYNIKDILNDQIFDGIRHEDVFKKFTLSNSH